MRVHGWRASAPSCGKLRRARRARGHSSSWCCALVHCGAIGAAFCDCQAAGEWRAARIVRGEARQSRPVRTRSRGTTASSALSMNACARVHLHEGVERACVRACVRPRLCVRFERCVCKRTCERASYSCMRACARMICWVLSNSCRHPEGVTLSSSMRARSTERRSCLLRFPFRLSTVELGCGNIVQQVSTHTYTVVQQHSMDTGSRPKGVGLTFDSCRGNV